MSKNKEEPWTSETLAERIWAAISVVPFLPLDGKNRNEAWMKKAIKEFEEQIRADERSKL